jgi:hypothetical protein
MIRDRRKNMSVPASVLNEMLVKKANEEEGPAKIDEVSRVFIRDRLWENGVDKPEVSSRFVRKANLLKWEFVVKLAGWKEARKVGVEITEQALICSGEPVTKFLEKAVKKELGLLGDGGPSSAHSTPIVSLE